MRSLSRLVNLALFILCATFCIGQAVPVSLLPLPQFQGFDANGKPLAFGCVFTYSSGNTNQLTTYSDYTGTIPNPNPVPLSASGSANIWLQAGQLYTIIVKSNGGTDCSLGTEMYSVDGIGGGSSQTSTIVPSGPTPSFPVIAQIQLFTMTLTADTVSLPVTFTNVSAPVIITFQLTQDSSGGHTFAWPPNVTGGATIDSAPNHTTTQTFVWNGTSILPTGVAFSSDASTLIPSPIASDDTFSGALTFTGNNTFSGTNAFSNAANTFKGASYTTGTANPSASGVIRLADTDTECWRNHANAGDVCLSKDTSDNFQMPNGLGLGNLLITYGGRATVGLGIPAIFGTATSTGNTANVGSTNLIASAGQSTLYRISCYVVITTAAGTSSTLPACNVGWTSFANNTAQTLAVTATSAGNTLNTFGQGSAIIDAKFATAITYSTSGYASNAAATMTYNVYVRAEAF